MSDLKRRLERIERDAHARMPQTWDELFGGPILGLYPDGTYRAKNGRVLTQAELDEVLAHVESPTMPVIILHIGPNTWTPS